MSCVDKQASPRSPPQPHLSRSVREQLQNAQADAIPSALQPPFQFRDRRHTALMVLHQLAVQICEGRERYPVAGAGAAPATAGAGGAAQGTVQDGRWSLRAAHLLFRAWTVVGVVTGCGGAFTFAGERASAERARAGAARGRERMCRHTEISN